MLPFEFGWIVISIRILNGYIGGLEKNLLFVRVCVCYGLLWTWVRDSVEPTGDKQQNLLQGTGGFCWKWSILPARFWASFILYWISKENFGALVIGTTSNANHFQYVVAMTKLWCTILSVIGSLLYQDIVSKANIYFVQQIRINDPYVDVGQ